MKYSLTRKQWGILILLVIIVPIIYNKTSGFITGMIQKQAMKMPKEVEVDTPHIESVNVSAEATGRVEAKYSVDLVARVPGFLIKKYFKEGDFVKKGQLLFQIDPREYQIEVNNSLANVNQYSALLKNAQQELNRANAKFPLFNSTHEGYAVILEEAEEAQEAMENVKTSLAVLWDRVKGVEV